MDHIGIDVHKRESCGSCGSGSLWQLWQRLPGPAGVRAWEVYVTGTGATRGVPAAGGR
jgi:hypothetical protein